MAEITFKLEGKQRVTANIGREFDSIKTALAHGLLLFGEQEMTESKRRTPVDTRPNAPHPGQLRSSGHVTGPHFRGLSGRTIEVVLAFGGAASGYAFFVHENLSAIHPVGEAEYLRRPLLESAPFMPARIAAAAGLPRG